jgi:hypothetical protein
VTGGVIGSLAREQSHITNKCVIGSQTFVPSPTGVHMQFVPGSHSSSSSADSAVFLSPSQAGVIERKSSARLDTVAVEFRMT